MLAGQDTWTSRRKKTERPKNMRTKMHANQGTEILDIAQSTLGLKPRKEILNEVSAKLNKIGIHDLVPMYISMEGGRYCLAFVYMPELTKN
jgi:hypothetical protein